MNKETNLFIFKDPLLHAAITAGSRQSPDAINPPGRRDPPAILGTAEGGVRAASLDTAPQRVVTF